MQCYHNTAIIHSRASQKSACFIFPVKYISNASMICMCSFIYAANEKWKPMGSWIFFKKFIGKPPPTIFFLMYDPNKNASWGTLLDCLIVIDELSPVKHSI